MVLSPPDTPPPAYPLGPQPKTAAGSESSKEELVSQPLSWLVFPPCAPPGPLPLFQAPGGHRTMGSDVGRPDVE